MSISSVKSASWFKIWKEGQADNGGITRLFYFLRKGEFIPCLSCDRSMYSSKWVVQVVRASASSFKFQYILFSLRFSSSCWRFVPHFLFPSVFPSITCLRMHFLHKMWSIHLPILHFIVFRFISHTIGLTDLLYPSPTPHLKTFKAFLNIKKFG